MAGRITILDETVINRIAAGEVVERPASVVKELVENSIDAEATSIQVDIENGGKKLIRVRDNGTGMSRDDAFLALERHATSKLRTEKDLMGIATMGFRGEALASIASVSQLRLLTCDGNEPAGTEIIIEGGALRKSDGLGLARGTVIEVRNLFFNVPVRRKFLKSPQVEAGHVQEFLTRFALAFPAIGFTYREDGRVRMDTPPVKGTFERIHTLYAKEVRDNLIAAEHSSGTARLHGLVARPPYARSNMRSVLTFVNGRCVRDRVINSAVTKAFANLMERGRFPFAILFLEVPPEEVDVNVHPQKAEVRFINPQQIYDLIVDGIYEALTGAPFNVLKPHREPLLPGAVAATVDHHLREGRRPDEPFVRPKNSSPLPAAAPAQKRGSEPPKTSARDTPEAPGRFASLGVLGALPNSFVVLYSDEELIVMDHHAAHERVLFERLRRTEHEREPSESQDLLIPIVLEFTALETRLLSAHLETLRRVGFSVEEFGDTALVVRGVPGWFGCTDLEDFFRSLVEVMLDTGTKGDPSRLKDELFKKMACNAAVKEASSMRPEEIKHLLRDLDGVGSIDVCPHGRPITARFSLAEIRRKMGRK
ncbi:MAG: DNA mismatch repair endonuclease MutL [Desulfomonile sp.]|nr:DNA mismatch repair endonuclease MutL [Desulfomonile sp.]